MIAAVCAWHQHHAPATGEITRRLRAAEPMFIAAPAAVEAYAVLTRLPAPYRLASADALRLIEVSFTSAGRLVALNAHLYGALLRRAAAEKIVGGRTHDAVIAECALSERDVALLTFNEDDFSSFAERGLEIVVPGR